MQWLLFLGHFTFTLTYRPGLWNVKPDALSPQFSPELSSLNPCPILSPSCIIGTASCLVQEKVQRAQLADPGLAETPHNCVCLCALLESCQIDLQPCPPLPWLHMAVDFVTEIPPSDGNTTILTAAPRPYTSSPYLSSPPQLRPAPYY